MSEQKPVAIVGIGAIMPDAPNAKLFWENILKGHYSIKDVPSDRWDTNLYYHSDPKVPDKTYSKIGSWVTNFEFNPTEDADSHFHPTRFTSQIGFLHNKWGRRSQPPGAQRLWLSRADDWSGKNGCDSRQLKRWWTSLSFHHANSPAWICPGIGAIRYF